MTRLAAGLALVIILSGSLAARAADVPESLADGSRRLASQASGYSLTFVRPVPDAEDSLWSAVELRRGSADEPRAIRSADPPQPDAILLAWSPYGDEGEPMDAWSPDGRFVAFREISCIWSPTDRYPVVCHMHETTFVDLDHPDEPCRGLLLGRYSFVGWVKGKPHTVRYSPTLTGDFVETDLGSCPGA